MKYSQLVHKYSYRVTKDECLDLRKQTSGREIYEIELKDKNYKSLAVDKANVELDLVPENPNALDDFITRNMLWVLYKYK